MSGPDYSFYLDAANLGGGKRPALIAQWYIVLLCVLSFVYLFAHGARNTRLKPLRIGLRWGKCTKQRQHKTMLLRPLLSEHIDAYPLHMPFPTAQVGEQLRNEGWAFIATTECI